MTNTIQVSEKRVNFLADVKHEIEALKKVATPEELSALNFENFDPSAKANCVYGQMTGSCDSLRAKELMDAACVRVLDIPDGVEDIMEMSIDDEEFVVNGKYEKQTWQEIFFSNRTYKYLSALEGYICTKDAKIQHVIEYLTDRENVIKLEL